jgi:hypothetical protein
MWEAACGDSRLGCPAKRSEAAFRVQRNDSCPFLGRYLSSPQTRPPMTSSSTTTGHRLRVVVNKDLKCTIYCRGDWSRNLM